MVESRLLLLIPHCTYFTLYPVLPRIVRFPARMVESRLLLLILLLTLLTVRLLFCLLDPLLPASPVLFDKHVPFYALSTELGRAWIIGRIRILLYAGRLLQKDAG